jgi:membrane associated rhomboid family serine protease
VSQPEAPPVCYRHPDRETYIACQRCGKPICPDCMRSAAVGFQCPDCVKEGAKSTRSGRTAYGGKRSGDAGLTSQILVGINALVWLLIVSTGGSGSEWFNRLALLPRTVAFRLRDGSVEQIRGIASSPIGDGGAYWQLVTSMFTHIELWHIGFNMLALWVLGPQLELVIGRARFLALYLLSGLAGSATVYWLSGEFSQTLGASGAIFGLMGALLVIAMKVGGDVRGLAGWIGVNFVITIVFASYISWQGHLGGFVGGAAIGAVLVYAPKNNRTQVQVLALAAVAVLIVVAVITRTVVLNA